MIDTHIWVVFSLQTGHSHQLYLRTRKQKCIAYLLLLFFFLNRDIPFQVKFKVFNAALMSSVLYGCESWFNGDLKSIEKLYNWAVK